METYELSVPLVRRLDQHGLRWLMRLHPKQGQLRFLNVQRLENESCRESVAREVSWELGLDRKRDFLVSNMAQLNVDFIGTLPGQTAVSCNRISFYNVEIFRQAALEKLEGDPNNVWVSSNEICEGITLSGIPLDPYMSSLIRDKGVIQAWESLS